MVSRLLSETPIHLPRVAASWSTEVVGIRRPWPTSSGPLLATTGAVPYSDLPLTAPPITKCMLPQP